MIAATITPIEIDGKHFVDVTIDGCALEPRGPFADETEAEVEARRIAGVCQVLLHGGAVVAPLRSRQKARNTGDPLWAK